MRIISSNVLALVLAVFGIMAQSVQAIILFGLDNAANQTDPGTGVHFDAVAKVYNISGGTTRGSAIHLGNGYMLTADHVATTTGQSFTFNGIDAYTLDTGFTPTQVAAGVDLKVFRLTTVPIVSAVSLSMGGELVAPATMVGWGLGRNPDDLPEWTTVRWGDHTTVAKRWGLNEPKGTGMIAYGVYDYEAIITLAGTGAGSPAGLGASEGAATRYDSGSGLFQYIGGQWHLIGVAATVQTIDSSTFGNDGFVSGAGDANYFVRVSTYHDDIVMLIPEPAAALLMVTGSLCLLRRRRADG